MIFEQFPENCLLYRSSISYFATYVYLVGFSPRQSEFSLQHLNQLSKNGLQKKTDPYTTVFPAGGGGDSSITQEISGIHRNCAKESPGSLALIASEWTIFMNKIFTQEWRPIPDRPLNVQAQGGLAICRRMQHHGCCRKLTRKAQEQLFNKISALFTERKGATQKHCYLSAVLTDLYWLWPHKLSGIESV